MYDERFTTFCYYGRPHFYAYPSAFFVFDYLADLTKCQKERKTALGPLGSAPPGRFAPECDDSGKYNKMQCYSVTDNCWCVDSRGLEIPGSRNKGRVSCPDKGLSLMLFTCCSAKSKKRKRTVPVLVFFFHEPHCSKKCKIASNVFTVIHQWL